MKKSENHYGQVLEIVTNSVGNRQMRELCLAFTICYGTSAKFITLREMEILDWFEKK